MDEQANLFNNERWVFASNRVIPDPTALVEPGQTMMFGYGSDVDVSDADEDLSSWTKDIASASNNNVHRMNRDLNVTALSVPSMDMMVEFAFLDGGYPNSSRAYGGNMGWGLPYDDDEADPNRQAGLYEISQVFYFPFSVDFLTDTGPRESVRGRKTFSGGSDVGSPGVKVIRENLTLTSARMSSLEEVIYNFRLRTTKENSANAIRPLIDGNIRAIWNNPKWDTNLGLEAISTHVFSDNETASLSPFPSPLDISGSEAGLPNGDGEVFQTVLFDIPRKPLVSLGQLQHAAAGRFSYEPSYIVGNSYANIRIPLDNWVNTGASDTYSSRHSNLLRINGSFSLYDASYLVNEALFDGYTFTTIPQDSTQAELDNYLDQNQHLQNPRYVPYQPMGLTFSTTNLQSDVGSGGPTNAGATNAGFVLEDGAFNVNSTSVEAWEVFLTGTKGLPYEKLDFNDSVETFDTVTGVRYPRVQTVLGAPWSGSPNNNSWFGFRELSTTEIRALAQAIVSGIEAQGPFHNLSEFINRQLDTSEAGKSGVLQTALDQVINSTLTKGTGLSDVENVADTGSFPQIASNSTQGAAFPTQLLQGDLLQALAPYMQTRSDTFTIRVYGEYSPGGAGAQSSETWIEAVVQRYPDPVMENGTTTSFTELAEPSIPFGRQFRIVSFRYLEGDEI